MHIELKFLFDIELNSVINNRFQYLGNVNGIKEEPKLKVIFFAVSVR